MQSLPFRMLVVNDLDLQDAFRSDQHNWHPLGVTEESEYQPLWKSKPNSPFPQELGLILLSAQPTTIKSLRLTVKLRRAPAKIVIFAALPPRQGVVKSLHSLDAVSRYLSVDWKQCGEPVVWEMCSSAKLDTSRDIDSRIIRLDAAECSFVKLVVHAPHENPRNQSQQVVLVDFELSGSTGDLGHIQSLHAVQDDKLMNQRSGVIHHPMLLPLANNIDELQAVLLEAGVPMDLVAQVANISISDTEVLLPATPQQKYKQSLVDAGKVVPESSSKGSDHVDVPDNSKVIEESDPASPFDLVLRQYIEQIARERSMLEEILTTKICKQTDEISPWQSPTILPTDPANSNEITLYTFGTFFTQCLLCGGADIQVTCLQMAERTAPLLKKAIGVTSAFEGIIALVVLGVREAKSSQVFQAAIHLAYTVFLTEVTIGDNASRLVESELDRSPDQGSNSTLLGLIEEVACINWSYGLRVILEWTLASRLCWLINHVSKPTTSKTSPHALNALSRFSKAPPSIDRGFLQFIRLLVNQDLTRTSFFNELLDLTPTGNATGLNFARNRLRLLRMVLKNDIIRYQAPANVKSSIHTMCTNILSTKDSPLRDHDTSECVDYDAIMTRLASECLAEFDRSASSGFRNSNYGKLLTSVRQQLEVSDSSISHHSHRYSHIALFVRDPLLDAEMTTFTAQLQRYFSDHPRPNALYRHLFVRASQSEKNDEIPETRELKKGNIAFQGEVFARAPPKETFHEELQRKPAPFVFDTGDIMSNTAQSLLPAGHQEVVSNFAAFRGTIVRRSDTPKRSSKVSPEQHVQAPSVSKSVSATTNKQPAIFNTANTVPSSDPAVKSPGQDGRKLTPGREIATTNQTSGQTPPTGRTIHMPAATAIDPPDSIPATTEQTPKQVEDTKQFNSNQHGHGKSKTKATTKEKPKDKTKNDGKHPDNCVLQ